MHYVICTKQTEDEFWADKKHDFIRGYHYTLFAENSRGLGECYNELADREDINDNTFLVFIHDDIVLNDFGSGEWCETPDEKLEKSEYDVIGLAGTASWTLKSPAVWHNSDQTK